MLCEEKHDFVQVFFFLTKYTSVHSSRSIPGKTVERVVGMQLPSALDEADYLDLLSGFRLSYSTEMALFVLFDYLWRTWDGGGAIILALLELLPTSDTTLTVDSF